LYVKTSANAQYQANNYNPYYEYTSQTISPSYLFSNTFSDINSWSYNQYLGRKVAIPTPKIQDWIVQPAFGNTVYAVSNEGNAFTIYGTYFSAHTHAGVNFNRTLSMGSPLFSTPNQTIYQDRGGQSSYISPINYYARQVLQFSPVLHGPILNY
jgi:hypothetical protein